MAKNNQKINPFLLQRQISQAIKKLPKEKRNLLGQAYINVLNDFQVMPIENLKIKYFGAQSYNVE